MKGKMLFAVFVVACIISTQWVAFADEYIMTPDGKYVGGSDYTMTPDWRVRWWQ